MQNTTLLFYLSVLLFVGCSPSEDMLKNEIRLPDGGKYKGETNNGLLHGKGEIIWSGGAKYVGEFKDGLMHGTGVLTEVNGSVYKGDFIEGMPDGNGENIYTNGDRYEGKFRQGLEHGVGQLVASNGDVINGIYGVSSNIQTFQHSLIFSFFKFPYGTTYSHVVYIKVHPNLRHCIGSC